ncbi:urea amidolyase associated protein UAAP1 [Corallincola spongiicola]|uniref:Urea carboxylase-associated family protein n=1 Tax=Corallincola spongiicola TaxID=2520508 RepID=A0ABY1WMN7_9GAMM|nr:urea amidolyase associated protein UAAP1 [Corallincola spongiicola]TAA43693.1 urea carboxylase-associated family protein [Corallincola spongiicola]
MSEQANYTTTIPAASHWSLRVRRGMELRIKDIEGGANLGMLFYNPEDLLERYNAPDTLKCQHTFKLTKGNCLYSDMGRIFCSITEDSLGWHDTVCGNSTKSSIAKRFGDKNYQQAGNQWHQNGYTAFLVELAKYGLGKKDMAANLNLFSKVSVDDLGNLSYVADHSQAGDEIVLRFEMDTLVLLHTCPHPLHPAGEYPAKPVAITLQQAGAVADDDICLTHCAENGRGFKNNALYLAGDAGFTSATSHHGGCHDH